MFDGKYFDWNQKRIKGIVDHFGYKFFYGKKIADLGCGYADLSGVLYRLGSEITAIDARQEHLKIVSKKFPGIKVVRSNLEGPWPLFGQKFDIILDLGLLCHLASYEAHLKAVCATTTHLILETAVCDSDDPHKHVQVAEGKDIYDLSFNGTGCRPTAAAIERILTECGMNFKRMDSTKFNSGEYTYDWASKNDGSTSIYKRRMWFATKNTAGVVTPFVGTQPAVLVQAPPAAPNFAYGHNPVPSSFLSLSTNSKPTVLTASPRPPMSSRMMSLNTSVAGQYTPNNYVENGNIALNVQVTTNSREFSLVMPETYKPPTTYQNFGVILPNTPSSRTWMRKILPFFPNIMVSSSAFTMTEFRKSDGKPNIIMCSLSNLVPNERVWIDEWAPGSLTNDHIEILKQCKYIVTPSLINAQDILKELPQANIIRVEKPWPMIEAPVIKYDYFLYFEKNENLTRILLDSWDDHFGKLIVVGSRTRLPTFAEYVSDGANYQDVTSLLMGAKAVIDLSMNTYYMSGILKLASSYSLPIISNNQSYSSLNNSVLITQNNTEYPTKEEIHKAISRFVVELPKIPARYNPSYNDELVVSIQKIIGV